MVYTINSAALRTRVRVECMTCDLAPWEIILVPAVGCWDAFGSVHSFCQAPKHVPVLGCMKALVASSGVLVAASHTAAALIMIPFLIPLIIVPLVFSPV